MSGLKLYSVSDSPPTLSVRLLLEALALPHDLVDVDFAAGQHLTEEYAKGGAKRDIPENTRRPAASSATIPTCEKPGRYPQGIEPGSPRWEESSMTTTSPRPRVAILQYLADKYAKNGDLYPKDQQKRAVVNHRLVFNLSTYYRYIGEYVMAPIFYAYERTALGLKKTNIGLSVFNTFLERYATKFAAGAQRQGGLPAVGGLRARAPVPPTGQIFSPLAALGISQQAYEMTIADMALVTSTMCLEAINFDLSPYPRVNQWYADFKSDYPSLWHIAEQGMKEIRHFDGNPPDLSALKHPIHPTQKK
ncbi:hypothetical protein PR048_023695 [Dryococelus australis]|uniref:Glutathione S-transferase n=1 Tax=Dryococelus australis TaxID=614101 RepID=A0ABQ9GUW6_9NEOP|nr:hypothetical protein PR048_023695 [Dryococelus australis]